MGVLVISSDTNSRADHNSNAAIGNATAEERERLVRKLESIGTLGEDDRAALRQLPLQVQAIPDNKDIVRDGDRPSKCWTTRTSCGTAIGPPNVAWYWTA